jgi:RimJ/RimL family protein N-acetyltransferase
VSTVEVPRDAAAAQQYGRTILEGERVRLRPLAETDLPLLERWWADPEWQALQQIVVRPRPEGTTIDMFRRWSVNDAPSGAGFSVEERDTGEFAGHVTMWGAVLPERAATLAIVLGPGFVGRGLGTDAVRVMVRYGFLVMGLNRIELRVLALNDRARRAYAKAGFVEEGVRREAVFLGGGFGDEVVMSVLRAEWTDA